MVLFHSPPSLIARFGMFLAVALATGSGVCRAEEPFQPFLDELHRRRLFDVALDYIASMRESSLIDSELRETLLYHEAMTLIESARYERDIPLRLEKLSTARDRLDEFVRSHPDHPLSATANLRLGDLVLIRAQANLQLAEMPSKANEKDALIQEAREQLEEAERVFTAAEAQFRSEFEAFPKFIDSNDRELREAKELARENLILATLSVGRAMYEASKAYAAGTTEFNAQLERAEEKFEETFKEWRRTPAGLYARMYQGRCHQDRGDTRQALSFYGELLVQPDEPQVFRELKAKVLVLAMECWNSDQEQQYAESISKGEDWLRNARRSEDKTPEGLAIRWNVAQAYIKRAAELPDGEPQKQRDLSAALDHATVVAAVAGDLQDAAREYVAAARNLDLDAEPTTFAEARDKGRAALNAMQAAGERIRMAPTVDESDKIPEYQNELQAARDEAMHYYRMALTMRTEETAIEDVNQVRYYLCFLNYQAERFYDALVLGEFIARHYPESSFGLKCSQVALAAMVRAYNEALPDQREFEKQYMTRVAELMAQQWPGAPETDEAWITLGEVAIAAGEREKVAEYLGHIAEDSPKRVQADLMTGRALWNLYLAQAASGSDAGEASDQLLAEARQLLERGVSGARAAMASGARLTFRLLTAELSLAQILVNAGDYEQALAVLETAESGPLALATRGESIAQQGNFIVETFKVALRAYVGMERLDDAEQMMAALEQAVAATGETARLTQIYLSLGVELEKQVARLRSEGKKEQLARVLDGFTLFLQRIAAQEQGNTFDSLSWVADTFYRLGEGLTGDESGVSAEAQKYFEQAASSYQRILTTAASQPDYVPSANALTGIRVRIARCQRLIGEYEVALEALVEVLREQPMALEAQMQAAYTYQDWGGVDPDNFLKALNGSHRERNARTGREANLVWGWGRLAQLVDGKESYREIYYEARYNVAECYYQLAMTQTADQRTASLQRARQSITVLLQLGGADLGGPQWHAKYDALMKEIQKASGERPVGLQAVETTFRPVGDRRLNSQTG